MAKWLKTECLHCSHTGGFLILVDLLSGCGVGVSGVGIGFVIGVGSGEGWGGVVADVGSGEGWAGVVAGVGMMGETGGYKVGGGGVLTSLSVLVGVIVSFLGVWRDVAGDLGGVVVSSEGEVRGR